MNSVIDLESRRDLLKYRAEICCDYLTKQDEVAFQVLRQRVLTPAERAAPAMKEKLREIFTREASKYKSVIDYPAELGELMILLEAAGG